MRRYDPDRPRWRQGLLNWVWLLWPSCKDRAVVDGVPVSCWLPRWHRDDHGFGSSRWPKKGAR